MQWLMHATALTYPRLQVLYDVHGEASLPEHCLEYLRGYGGAVPVRIGNRAQGQYQLDVYGQVIDALYLFAETGNELDSDMRRRLVNMAEVVVAEWRHADHGMWEIPTLRQQYVHSKVMCWLALDRAERLVRKLGMQADLETWASTRDLIRDTVLREGYSSELGTFLQTVGGRDPDALSLVFPLLGFLPGDEPRVVSTVDYIQRTLGVGDLLYRYRIDDGLPGKEGAFLACSFWLVEALAVAGRREEAQRLYESLESRANDVGLYSEEMDAASGKMLGNFPQGLTHLAHISAALRLDQTR
jgi:GH15 family glucan-1,4-alpha-glucosidase